MHSIFYYIVQIALTVGSSLLGVVICIGGGVFCYRSAKSRQIGRITAALAYFFATLLPFGVAWMSGRLGNYLEHVHKTDVFFGEATWGMFILMYGYIGFAIVANLVLWLILGFMKVAPRKQG
jgi:hypothetical protein